MTMRTTRRIVPILIALVVLFGGCSDAGSGSAPSEDEWANAVCDAAMTLKREAPWEEGYNASVVNPALARLSETLAGLDPPPTASDELRQDFERIRELAAVVTLPTTTSTSQPGVIVQTPPNHAGPIIEVTGQVVELTVNHYEEIPALRPLYDPFHAANEPYDSPCHEYVAATGGDRGNPAMVVD